MENTQPAPLKPRVLTEAETAIYIGMSQAYLARSRCEGHRENRTKAPPFIRIGRSIRYIKDDLDAWLLSKTKFDHLDQEGACS